MHLAGGAGRRMPARVRQDADAERSYSSNSTTSPTFPLKILRSFSQNTLNAFVANALGSRIRACQLQDCDAGDSGRERSMTSRAIALPLYGQMLRPAIRPADPICTRTPSTVLVVIGRRLFGHGMNEERLRDPRCRTVRGSRRTGCAIALLRVRRRTVS